MNRAEKMNLDHPAGSFFSGGLWEVHRWKEIPNSYHWKMVNGSKCTVMEKLLRIVISFPLTAYWIDGKGQLKKKYILLY